MEYNASRRRLRLLLLFPGPVQDPLEYFGARLEWLSHEFEGSVLTFGEYPARLTVDRFQIHALRFEAGRKARGLLALCCVALRLARRARRSGRHFDLVVTYDPLKTGLVGYWIARLTGAPLAVEVNGDYTAWANYSDVPNPLIRRLKRTLYLAVERFVLHRADGIKLLYPGQIDAFSDALSHQVIHTFPNFVDLSLFHDRGETKEILLVGFPFHVKGVDLLIDAFKLVSPRFPDWRLKILGWFPDPQELQAAIAGHPKIEVHPPVSRPEVAKHIGECGVLVLPSRTEAMGRVLLEAMACGKPRIGAAVGGIPTVINHGADGLLFEGQNATSLAACLELLLQDPELRRRLGGNAEVRARTEFSSQAYVTRLHTFYHEVISTRAGREWRALSALVQKSLPGRVRLWEQIGPRTTRTSLRSRVPQPSSHPHPVLEG